MPLSQPALWAAAMVAGCAGLAALLILVVRPLLLRHLLAHPNDRSSHNIATPQGAGLAVMATVLVGTMLAPLLWGPLPGPPLLAVLATAVFLTLLGALDDAHALPVSWRLIGQTLAALALVFSLPQGVRLLPDLMPLVVELSLIHI